MITISRFESGRNAVRAINCLLKNYSCLNLLPIRGSFFMFVESGCISTNIKFTYHKYIYFERSSFYLSTDINFTSLAFSSVKIYSFEKA